MTLNGLEYDFYGEKLAKPTEALSEKDFEISVSNDDVKYKIKGFIDKLFLYKGSKTAIIRDFKTSKSTFKGKEVSDNLQDYMYSLAARHLYPEYKNRSSEFLFLKFDLNDDLVKSEGAIKMEGLSDDDLDGFEYQLSSIQQYLDNFSEADAQGSFAAKMNFPTDNSFSGPLQCGFAKEKGQLKKDGTVMWHCPMKFDFDYYTILNKEGKIIKSYTEEEFSERLVPEGCSFEKKYYAGCPAIRKKY